MPPKKKPAKKAEDDAPSEEEAELAAQLAAAKQAEELGLKLRDAVRERDLWRAQVLVKQSDLADLNFEDCAGWSCMHYAARQGDVPMVEWLAESGAQVDRIDRSGMTPLLYACRNGHTEVVQLLNQGGANIQFSDMSNATALHYGTQWGHPEIVRILLQAQADVHACDQEGKSCLHLAADGQHGERDYVTIRHLLDHGADPHNLLDNYGFSAVECCSSAYLRTLIQCKSPGGSVRNQEQEATAAAEAVFKVLDTDQDGVLNCSDLCAGLEDVGCTRAEISGLLSGHCLGDTVGLDQFKGIFPEYRCHLLRISQIRREESLSPTEWR